VRTGSSGGRYVVRRKGSPTVRTAKLQHNILGTNGLFVRSFVLIHWQQAAVVNLERERERKNQQIAAQFYERHPHVLGLPNPNRGLTTEVQNL